MNKAFILLCSAMLIIPAFGQNQSIEDKLSKAITEYQEVIETRPTSAVKGRARTEFYDQIKEIGTSVDLKPLHESPFYFNILFSESVEDVGSEFSDYVIYNALQTAGYFTESGRPARHCNLFRPYLEERFKINLTKDDRLGLYQGFADPKFMDGLGGLFEGIILANSDEEKKAVEANAISFIENYEYVSWREREAKKDQEKKEAPRGLRSASDQNVVGQDRIRENDQPKVGETLPDDQKSTSWALWAAVVLFIMALVVYLMRRRQHA